MCFLDSSTNNLVNQYFPKKECLSFDQANPNAILGKCNIVEMSFHTNTGVCILKRFDWPQSV